MTNPFIHVKNTRESYSRFYQKVYTEVEVQFGDEDPTWMPKDTLLAMSKIYFP